MNFEKYTERSRGFIQSAQTLAQRSSHQRLTPEHLLKVLLDDKEGLAANLMRAAGADPARALKSVEAELAKQPKIDGGGAGQVFAAPEISRVFEAAEKAAEKAGDGFVTAERLLLEGASPAEVDKALRVSPHLGRALLPDEAVQAVVEALRWPMKTRRPRSRDSSRSTSSSSPNRTETERDWRSAKTASSCPVRSRASSTATCASTRPRWARR